MAKRWVSLLGTNFTSGYPSEGGSFDDVAWESNAQGRLESAGIYATLATLCGNPARLAELAGLAVYGLRWTCVVDLNYNADPFQPLGNAFNFANAEPTAVNVTARMVFDLPGADPQFQVAQQEGRPPSSEITGAPGSQIGQWRNPPPGWTWDVNGTGGTGLRGRSRARQMTYTPKRVLPGVTSYQWYATGTQVSEFQRDLPVGLMRAGGDAIDPNYWGGGVCSVQGLATRGAAFVRFTRLDVLVNERPTWTASIKQLLTIGASDNGNFTFRAYHQDGEPLAGAQIRVRSQFGGVSFLGPDGTYSTNLVVTTDGDGRVTLPVRADIEGFDTIHLTDANTPTLAGVFSPVLMRQQLVQVVAPAGGGNPGSGGVVCTVIPEQPYIPPNAARVDTTADFGWNAGANSIVEVTGNANLQFDMPAVIGVIVGITNTREDSGNRDRITHGFYFGRNGAGNPAYQIFEAGVTRMDLAPYTAGDQFRITRIGGVVRYYKWDPGKGGAWVLLYTSGTSSKSDPIYAACAMYASGDEIP